MAPLPEPIHDPNKHAATLRNSGSPSSCCGITITCQEDLCRRSNFQFSLPLWGFQEWWWTPSYVKVSRSTTLRAHSWPKQTCSNTQKQWQSIILVWYNNHLPGRLVPAVEFSNLVAPLRVSSQEWQGTPSKVKLSRSTIVRAHPWPKLTYSNTQKQWQSIILVWHTNILPGRLVMAVEFSNLAAPMRVSRVAGDSFQGEIVT